MTQAVRAESGCDEDGKRAFYRVLTAADDGLPDFANLPDALSHDLARAYPVSEAQKQRAWQSLRQAAEMATAVALEAGIAHTPCETTSTDDTSDIMVAAAGQLRAKPGNAIGGWIDRMLQPTFAESRRRIAEGIAFAHALMRWYVLDDAAFTRASHCPHHEYAHLLSAGVPIKGGGVFKGGYAVVMVGFTLA